MTRLRLGTLLLVFVALTFAASCGGDDDEAGVTADVTVETGAAGETTETSGDTVGAEIDAPFGFDLDPLGDSGVSGQVTITPSGTDETDVEVTLDSTGPDVSHPVHIHEGTCDNLTPEPAFPLENVREGSSAQAVDVGVDELLDGEYAINVHESDENLDNYIACGEFPSRDEVIQGDS